MKKIKKGSAELISIVIAIVVVGALALAIANYMGKKTTDAQEAQMTQQTNNALSVIKG